MLAITTTDSLVLADSATIKRSPSLIPSSFPLTSLPTASAWALDNSALFIASNNSIWHYEVAANSISELYVSECTSPIVHLAVKDPVSLVFAQDNITYTIQHHPVLVVTPCLTHASTVSSLSLSNDGSFLVSTSVKRISLNTVILLIASLL